MRIGRTINIYMDVCCGRAGTLLVLEFYPDRAGCGTPKDDYLDWLLVAIPLPEVSSDCL